MAPVQVFEPDSGIKRLIGRDVQHILVAVLRRAHLTKRVVRLNVFVVGGHTLLLHSSRYAYALHRPLVPGTCQDRARHRAPVPCTASVYLVPRRGSGPSLAAKLRSRMAAPWHTTPCQPPTMRSAWMVWNSGCAAGPVAGPAVAQRQRAR